MMKKAIKILVIFGLLMAILLPAAPAVAADDEPSKGPYSTLMLEAFAAETGKTVEEIETLRESGLTYREIAIDLGYEGEELSELFDRVGEAVLALAVEDGIITQEESDQLSKRLKLIKNIASWLVNIFLQRLGLTREEVVVYLQSGMTLREIMEMQGIDVGQGIYKRCGLSMEDIISRIRAGETLNEICPSLVDHPASGSRFQWPSFDWSHFEPSGYTWPWQNQP